MATPEGLLERIARALGGDAVIRALSALPSRDLQSLLLHVLGERARAKTPLALLAQFEEGGAPAPSYADPRRLNEYAREYLAVTAGAFEPIDASPVVPLGAAHALGGHTFRVDLARLEGLGYYAGPCLRITAASPDGARYPLSDGGALRWVATLLSDERERFVTSGLGADLVCARFIAPT